MSITLHTVDNGVVNAINDAKYYEKLTNSACGLVEGGVVTIVSANTLHITSGWGIILGRLFTINAEDINVETSASGTVNGRLKMVIDLSNPDTPISFASEARSSLPALTQEDLNNGGFVYEFALATYDIDELNATNIVSNTPISITPALRADYVAKADKYNMYHRGDDPITAVANDTTVNWKSLGTGIFHYKTANCLTDQPSQYGYIINLVTPNGTSDVGQIWMVMSTGKMYYRGGNNNGWNGTWKPLWAGTMSLSGTTLTITSL